MDVLDLVAKIKLDTDEYEKGLDDAESKAGSFGSKLKSGLGTAAKVGGVALLGTVAASVKLGKSLTNGANELANYGDHVDKMSQKMGISAEAYQEWDAVLQHSGTSIDSMQRGMMTLSKAAVDSKEEFEKLNITEEELATLSQEDLFGRVIEGLQEMGEGAERTATAQALLGGAAKELGPLLNTTAEETQAMKDRVRELGGVMSDEAVKDAAKFKDNLQDMQTAMAGLKRGIMSDTLPALSSLMDGFTKLIAGEEGADEALNNGMSKLGQAIEQMMPKIGNLLENLLPRVLEFGAQLVSGIAQQIPQIIVAIAKQIPSLIKTLLKTIAKLIPQMIKAGADLITELANGIGNGGGEVLDIIMEILDNLISAIMDNLPQILDAGLTIVENLVMGILQKLPDIIVAAADIITHLIEGITQMLPEILKKGKDVILNIVHGITQNLPAIIEAIVQVINTLLTTITENLPEILNAGIDIILELVSGLIDALPEIIAAVPKIISTFIDNLLSLDNLGKILEAGVKIIGKVVEGLLTFLEHAGEYAGKIIGGFIGALGELFGDLLQAGKDLMGAIWDGMKEIASGIMDWAAKFGDAVWDAILGDPTAHQNDLYNASQEFLANNEEYQRRLRENEEKYGKLGEGGKSSSDDGGSSGGGGSSAGMPTNIPTNRLSRLVNNSSRRATENIMNELDDGTTSETQNSAYSASGMMGVSSGLPEDFNIVIPVYIGQERFAEAVVNAQTMHNYITGGR